MDGSKSNTFRALSHFHDSSHPYLFLFRRLGLMNHARPAQSSFTSTAKIVLLPCFLFLASSVSLPLLKVRTSFSVPDTLIRTSFPSTLSLLPHAPSTEPGSWPRSLAVAPFFLLLLSAWFSQRA
ncbi:hypothetical protein IE53DRAFT_250774 [Violaceomyces palustris]|uniref:Uncharacterized protein n=1 Tax=Violaceomyces palustris TaxID=1673888 RepID=A0ACD0NNS1_9BASI|nr:hypothetical protein IE53DRAFT_250774 [Violaceomyces palustris]